MGSCRLLSLLLALAAVAPFLGTVGHGFLNWDDPEYVPENPLLRSPAGLVRIWTSFDNPQVYPLVFTSYWLEYRLWGAGPAGYHAVNLLLHAAATLLLFRLLLRLGIGTGLSFAASLLFAVHPTQAASVAWVSERKNVLSGAFYFACLLAYAGALADRSRTKLIASWALAAAALLSKTTTVTLPLAAALLEWWFARSAPSPHPDAGRTGSALPPASARSLPPAHGRGRPARRDLPGRLWRLAPLALLALIAGGLTVLREHGPRITSDVSPAARFWIAGRALWFDAGKLLLPIGLCGVYPRWNTTTLALPGIVSWVGILLVAGALWRFRARLPRAVPFGLLQFGIATLPTSGIVPFGYMEKSFVADHFLYLPSWGFWLAFFSLIEWAAARAKAHFARPVRAAPIAAVVMAAAFIPATALHARDWRDSLTFWNRVLERDRNSWLAYGNRGQYYASTGRLEPALADLREAVRLRPAYVEAYFNLGYVLERLGRADQARAAYEATLRLSPADPDAHNNLGVLYMRSGDLARARREFEAVLDLLPDDPAASRNLRLLQAAERRTAGSPKDAGN